MPDTTIVRGFAAAAPGAALKPVDLTFGPLADDEVELEVECSGICHSDLSMLNNDWQMTTYPFVGGHEVIGKIVRAGARVTDRKVGQRVGIGWNCRSDLGCPQCIKGDHNLSPTSQGVIVNHHGGFADRVRAQSIWTFPIPDALDHRTAGPLLCGGITVFNPFVQAKILPTARVGVLGIGGLGHLVLRFARAWGCDVTAFTSTEAKKDEAIALGAHRAIGTRDAKAVEALAGSLDLLIVTVNVSLDWGLLVNTLAPRGVLYPVGAVLEPMVLPLFPIMLSQRWVTSSPTGSPTTIAAMLDFCARHGITAQCEHFPMKDINVALDRLRGNQLRYRAVVHTT